jgi:hypothetical protein
MNRALRNETIDHTQLSRLSSAQNAVAPPYSAGIEKPSRGSNAGQFLGRQIQQPVHRVARAGGVAPTDAVDDVLMYV